MNDIVTYLTEQRVDLRIHGCKNRQQQQWKQMYIMYSSSSGGVGDDDDDGQVDFTTVAEHNDVPPTQQWTMS